MKCEFTSVWDDGSVVTTPCEYDPETGLCDPEVSKGPIPTGMLKEEFITLPDGKECLVCNVCHEYTMRPVINEHTGKQLSEELECNNPNCSDEE
jgi:hypothetical protein